MLLPLAEAADTQVLVDSTVTPPFLLTILCVRSAGTWTQNFYLVKRKSIVPTASPSIGISHPLSPRQNSMSADTRDQVTLNTTHFLCLVQIMSTRMWNFAPDSVYMIHVWKIEAVIFCKFMLRFNITIIEIYSNFSWPAKELSESSWNLPLPHKELSWLVIMVNPTMSLANRLT